MMGRLGSSDSLAALIPSSTGMLGDEGGNGMICRELQSMLEEEGCVEQSGSLAEKKRRLSLEQVKALEKNFEKENKLEPERKVKLAQELGLQPRQVAVWFQNRRARWKTKQLERDYSLLKANYDALKHNYDALQLKNESLKTEIRQLKSKLPDDNGNSESEEAMTEWEGDDKSKTKSIAEFDDSLELNQGSIVEANNTDPKDGVSDSDSTILNEDNSPKAEAVSPTGAFDASSVNCFPFYDSKVYQPQFVKIEQHNFFGGEESCTTFFPDDQAPTLHHWYCPAPDEWR